LKEQEAGLRLQGVGSRVPEKQPESSPARGCRLFGKKKPRGPLVRPCDSGWKPRKSCCGKRGLGQCSDDQPWKKKRVSRPQCPGPNAVRLRPKKRGPAKEKESCSRKEGTVSCRGRKSWPERCNGSAASLYHLPTGFLFLLEEEKDISSKGETTTTQRRGGGEERDSFF